MAVLGFDDLVLMLFDFGRGCFENFHIDNVVSTITATVHDRMPVILHPDSYDLWLDPGMTNVQVISELLKPYDAQLMRYSVGSRVNNVANDDEECSRPVILATTQSGLFA
jgi:hypothetical protein